MGDNKQLITVVEMIKKADNLVTAMKILTDKVSDFLKNGLPGKEELLKLFEVWFLYLMDKYFAEVGLKLYDWMDEPLPDVQQNTELQMKLEKLKRKEKRMTGKAYKKRFWRIWYKEFDEGHTNPLRKFDNEEYRLKMDKVEYQMNWLRGIMEDDIKNRQAEIMGAHLEELLVAMFYGFEASEKIQNSVVSYVLQTANLEYFLLLVKRISFILELGIRKNDGWAEKNVVLGRFILSLKQKIKDLTSLQAQTQDPAVLKRITILRDIGMETELFVIEINNSIIARRKQENFQEGLQNTLENGFKQIAIKLGAIENGIITTNKQMAGMTGRLTDILKVDKKILDSTIQNGKLIGPLSNQLDGISEQLSGIREMMSEMMISEKK